MPTKTTLCQRFGQKIRDSRKTAGLTQEALASNIGVTRSQLGNIEKGLSWVGIDTLYYLIIVLSLRIDRRTFRLKGKTNDGRSSRRGG